MNGYRRLHLSLFLLLAIGLLALTSCSDDPADPADPGNGGQTSIDSLVAVARNLGPAVGIGASIRFLRGSVDGESRSRAEGEVGVFHRSSLPLEPRFGLAVRGLGGEVKALGGVEVSAPSVASSRIPLRFGYGFLAGRGPQPTQHRFSFRGSWMDLIHLGMGVSHLGENNGWAPLWMLGTDIGRYSFAVLRESMANDFGAIHFFRAAIRFPREDTPLG